jgi:hypothetical protein
MGRSSTAQGSLGSSGYRIAQDGLGKFFTDLVEIHAGGGQARMTQESLDDGHIRSAAGQGKGRHRVAQRVRGCAPANLGGEECTRARDEILYVARGDPPAAKGDEESPFRILLT